MKRLWRYIAKDGWLMATGRVLLYSIYATLFLLLVLSYFGLVPTVHQPTEYEKMKRIVDRWIV